MKELTRSISDGLVKQDNAYVVTGSPPAPGDRYPENRTCFYANVHRAHSGNRGIFNTLANYENIQRFLFGDTRAELSLENIDIKTAVSSDRFFYDFEFSFSIRNSGAYLHRRQQDPCENAIRLERASIPPRKRAVLEVSPRMAYTLGLYLYLFVGSVVAGSSAAWLSPLGFAVNFIFAAVVAYLGVVVGRWLFGRKFL